MLKFTNEEIIFNNEKFNVLDAENVSFDNAVYGIKSKTTKVVCAKGGEKIVTRNKEGKVESVTVAEKGDAIFCNSETDVYIPHNSDGSSWKFNNIESYGYDIVSQDNNSVVIRSNNKALLLVGAVDRNTCIKDAWGEGQHQFLYKGATLKKDLNTGKVTGIDKDAFEATWAVLDDEQDKD